MSNTTTTKLVSIVALVFFLLINIMTASVMATDVGQMSWVRAGSGCDGTVGECLVGFDEDGFELDSETHRRILATSNYISYGALNRNRVPCSRRGVSYYNCRPGAQANPYSRGCSTITRCRRR